MSEEKKELEVNCPACFSSFRVELHQSVYSSLPWRKPSERPENKRDVLCFLTHLKDFFSGTCYWSDQEWKYTIESEHSEYKICQVDLFVWLYADELPLPDWVQK